MPITDVLDPGFKPMTKEDYYAFADAPADGHILYREDAVYIYSPSVQEMTIIVMTKDGDLVSETTWLLIGCAHG